MRINRYRAKQRVLLFLFSCLFGHLVLAQDKKKRPVYYDITRSDLSEEMKMKGVDSLLSLYEAQGKKDSVEFTAFKYTNWIRHFKGPEYYIKAAKIYDLVIQNNSRDTLVLQQRYFKSGGLYKDAGLYSKSISTFEKAILLLNDSEYAALSYIELARIYYDLGDYDLSLDYYNRSKKLLHTLSPNDKTRYYFLTYNTLSRINTPEARNKFLHHINEAQIILDSFEVKKEYRLKMNRASGLYFSDPHVLDVKRGSEYLFNALNVAKELKAPEEIVFTYQNLGALFQKENPKKAIEYSELGLSIANEKFPEQSATLLANIGLSYARLNLFDAAIENMNSAITSTIQKDIETLNRQEVLAYLKASASDENLWIILSNLGQVYFKKYEVHKNVQDVDKALVYFDYVDAIFDELQGVNVNTSSKFLWRRMALETYSLAIKASYIRGDADLVFRYMEKSKALVLIEEMKDREALITSNVPEYLVFRMAQLKSEIAGLEGQKTSALPVTDRLLETKRKLHRLTDSIKGKYNTPKVNTYHSEILVRLKEAKSILEKNQCIVEYHLSSDSGYGLVTSNNIGYGLLIEKEQTRVFEIPDLQGLKDLVVDLQSQISRPFKNEQDKEQYRELSYAIYNKLFPTDAIKSAIKGKQVKLVLDDFLNRIPLEALSVSDTTSKLKYLVEDADVHYSYSVTFDNNIENSPQEDLSFLAMAPVQFDDENLGSLEHSEKELEALNSIFNGNCFTGEHASKKNFLKNQNSSQILHLATHANAADSISPWISFREEKLSLNELYLINNNAAMVVLSACNTSTGELASGEGVLSLSRGFFYGGAQSVVSSLWSVDDIATSELMTSFYSYLDEGLNKGAALNKAKLDYLSVHSGSQTSPYYWASFVVNGNIDAVQLEKNTPLWWYILIGVFVIGIGAYLFKKHAAYSVA